MYCHRTVLLKFLRAEPGRARSRCRVFTETNMLRFSLDDEPVIDGVLNNQILLLSAPTNKGLGRVRDVWHLFSLD